MLCILLFVLDACVIINLILNFRNSKNYRESNKIQNKFYLQQCEHDRVEEKYESTIGTFNAIINDVNRKYEDALSRIHDIEKELLIKHTKTSDPNKSRRRS